MRIVIDTSVLVAAARSRQGARFYMIRMTIRYLNAVPDVPDEADKD